MKTFAHFQHFEKRKPFIEMMRTFIIVCERETFKLVENSVGNAQLACFIPWSVHDFV